MTADTESSPVKLVLDANVLRQAPLRATLCRRAERDRVVQFPDSVRAVWPSWQLSKV